MTTLHQQIHAAVEQRITRGALTNADILRLKLVKLIEEACELSEYIHTPIRYATAQTQALARASFTHRSWLRDDRHFDFEKIKQEIADCYVVLATMEQEIIALTGAEWDMQQAALEKATADRERTT
jgi:NTP pyrophosphatase (non-canonical NTP hydrolase)